MIACLPYLPHYRFSMHSRQNREGKYPFQTNWSRYLPFAILSVICDGKIYVQTPIVRIKNLDKDIAV